MADLSKQKYSKNELFWSASTCVNVHRPSMKALAVLENRVGFDALYERVEEGDMYQIASWLTECNGYDGPPLADQVESELLDNGLLQVEAERFGDKFRLADQGGLVLVPLSGNEARQEAISTLEDSVAELETYRPEDGILKNIYRYAIEQCRDGRYKALFDVKAGAAKVQPADASGLPEPKPGQTVVRERVVEREKEPVLETMLRQAMMNAMVDMNLDTLTEELKRRLVEEFGFEPIRHTVVTAEAEHDVDGVVHEKFDEVLHYVQNDIPTYCYGPCGSGKGVLGRQVAEALGMDYYFMTSVTDEFKINGYMDAYGMYHETPFHKAFKNGGVFFLDELDASAPEVLVCLNMAISDRRYTFPHESIEAHPDFRVIAAGNTLGSGADAIYTGRMQLDGASLNRFVICEVDYDPKIDALCADNDVELVEFAKKFRECAKECGLPIACSYRNITQIRVGAAKFPLEDVLRSCLCKEMNQDDINIMAEKISLGGNRYYQAFRSVRAIVG